MDFVVFISFFFATVSSITIDQCPPKLPRDGFLKVHGNSCFRFHLFELREYTEARETCASEGGSLILVKTKEIQDFIKDSLRHSYNKFDGLIWIGLTDELKEKQFIWEDGTLLRDEDFQNWASGQGPGHLMQFYEDCVVIEPWENYKWHDYHCTDAFLFSNSNAFICQFDVSSDVVTPGQSSGQSTGQSSGESTIIPDTTSYISQAS